MKFVCDVLFTDRPGRTWFALETESEALAETEAMHHAVHRFFQQAQAKAIASYKPIGVSFIERDIGLRGHIARAMPIFLTLRADDGEPLATAMLPPGGEADANFRCIIVGPANADPYATQADAIEALGRRYGVELPRAKCFPYS